MRIWNTAVLALVGSLVLAGCSQGPKKPTPKDDPKTEESIKNEPKIELPSFDGPEMKGPEKKTPAKDKETPKPSGDSKDEPKPEEKKQAAAPPAVDGELAQLKPAELVARLGDSGSREAATAAIKARGQSLVKPLTEMLASKDGAERANAAFALSLLGKDAAPAADKLKQIAQADDHEAARDAAQFALDAISGK